MKTTLRKTSAVILGKLLAILSIVLIATTCTQANNISVSNISITGKNTTAGTNNAANYSMVKFNLAWENSWRSAALNWDAAWVFVKYRVNGGAWNHCNLNNTGHTAATGSTIDAGLVTPSSAFNITTNPAVGVFIYKNADGNGNVNYQNVQLRWNYGSQGVADNAVLDVQVFAIEMVYVPTGTFAVGDGGTLNQEYTLTTINTGNATTAPSGTGSLGGQAGGYPTGQSAPANVNFPNGYNAFYCMKYEISQGQYVDFLNTLTYNQQLSRTNHRGDQPINIIGNYALVNYNNTPSQNNGSKGNAIRVKTIANPTGIPAVFESINYNLPCNYLTFDDFCSLISWSGLRPMTELEYEKSCRGTITPIQGEFAWGNASLSGNNYYSFDYCCNFKRVGSFATNSSGRVSAGASYYGIMELTANVVEQVIICDGSSVFIGTNGNGNLDSVGNKLNSDWDNFILKGSINFVNQGNSSFYVISSISSHLNSGYVEQMVIGGRGVRSAQ
jgi:formylglycine-generating enzyme required for sulfatase activity